MTTILEQKIVELVTSVRENQKELSDLEARLATAKLQLAELLKMQDGVWRDETGYARISSGHIHKVYDTQALDELIISDPLRYGWLQDYRKVVHVKSDVQVR